MKPGTHERNCIQLDSTVINVKGGLESKKILPRKILRTPPQEDPCFISEICERSYRGG